MLLLSYCGGRVMIGPIRFFFDKSHDHSDGGTLCLCHHPCRDRFSNRQTRRLQRTGAIPFHAIPFQRSMAYLCAKRENSTCQTNNLISRAQVIAIKLTCAMKRIPHGQVDLSAPQAGGNYFAFTFIGINTHDFCIYIYMYVCIQIRMYIYLSFYTWMMYLKHVYTRTHKSE